MAKTPLSGLIDGCRAKALRKHCHTYSVQLHREQEREQFMQRSLTVMCIIITIDLNPTMLKTGGDVLL